MSNRPHIIAIAGGQNAMQQSIVSAFTSVCLAGANQHCMLASLGSNDTDLRQLLNIECVRKRNVPTGRSNVHVQHTIFKNLDAIAFDSFDDAALDFQQKEFFQQIKRLEADFIILDLGTATCEFSLNAFLLADERFIITTSDMYSILDAYSLTRSALLYELSKAFQDYPQLVSSFKECGFLVDGKYVKPLDSVAATIKSISEDLYNTFHRIIASFQPRILLIKDQPKIPTNDFKYLKPLAKDLLGIDVIEAGSLRIDYSDLSKKDLHSLLACLKKSEPDMVRLLRDNILPVDLNSEQLTAEWILKNNLKYY